ncbi:hypothetical protein BOR84_10750 [Corynebacterium striatum]|uniref:Chitin-binding type-3 domain-containing protein n=1 Tax=Corynebacterium striatum TaxID=43770 RepID=A0ABC8CIG7_CORST|nr:carbohydrate-binding protein [Corynebacterium striatum]ATZ08301.1 hypothetical protein A9D01_05500 [Corynebacterium striatum]EGT5613310.1 hypothetical protein [Corynebacterium striatum]
MTFEQVKQDIQQLTDDEVEKLGVWIYGDERERRSTLKAVEQAQAEVVKELQDAGKLPLPDALTDPEKLPAAISDVPEWVSPGTDHSMMYREGDIISYEGAHYRVLSAHTTATHWPPDQAHALFEKL